MAESTAFPWLKHLPEEDAREFFEELSNAFGEAQVATMPGVLVSAETYVKHLDPLIHAWKATAEVHADPEMYKALTQPMETEDLGLVTRPHLHDFDFDGEQDTCIISGCNTTWRDFLVRRPSNKTEGRVPNQREGGHDHEQW